ncbi:MAG: serine/threonine protein kinase, partial [Xanthomonadaceae bacterium]|nr:serine/threonine protein kinase [Xanthomonadaceae bacterium]
RMLGEGGMGQVWLARRADGLYQRRVALKLLRPGLADPNLRQRFNRERQILARLGHPHIARLLDAGISVDNQPYLALEYVEGEAITDWCRSRDLDTEERTRLFLQVCEAVSHAHANLIVHRDLKPSNILVTPLDEVRLLDFGIAKLLDGPEPGRDSTRTEVRAFTLHYAAPEQIRGEPVTTMTDVYSLGVVLYELLAETKPYRLSRQSDAAWEEAILLTDPQKPSMNLQREADSDPSRKQALRRRAREISGDLDNIVLKALSKRPEQRYASVEAFALDLNRYLEGKPVLARPQSLTYRSHKFMHRHRWVLATAALILSVMTSALGLVTWQVEQAKKETNRAQALQNFVTGLFEQTGGASAGPLDVRDLLRAGEQRANRELAAQPLTRAELFGVLAKLRLSLGDYQDAERLLKLQATLIEPLEDAPYSLRLGSASDLGRAQRQLGQAQACVAQMAPLEAEARRLQGQLPVHVATFYSELGRCRSETDEESELARVLFQRSLEIRRNTLDDIAGVVENLGDLAALYRDDNKLPEALRGYRNALAQLQASVGDRHPLAIELQRNLCALERRAGHLAIAERDCYDALSLALELRGEDHPDAIDARRQFAAILVDQGRLDEAEAAFTQTRARLAARLGERHAKVARDDNSLGIIAFERGDTETALKLLDRALATLRKTPEDEYYQNILFNKAMVLQESGRDQTALTLLRQVERLRIARVGKEHALIGDTARLIGEAQAALGQNAQARARLQQAVRLTRTGYDNAHPNARRADLSLALFDLRQIAAAAESASASEATTDADTPPAAATQDVAAESNAVLARLETLSALPQGDPELRKIAWVAAAAVAATRCRSPVSEREGEPETLRATKAMETLDALETKIREAMPQGGSVQRQFERLRADCR